MADTLQSGCDFSKAVALFKPDELELNCGNMDQLEQGEFIGKGFWREVYKTKWNGEAIVEFCACGFIILSLVNYLSYCCCCC